MADGVVYDAAIVQRFGIDDFVIHCNARPERPKNSGNQTASIVLKLTRAARTWLLGTGLCALAILLCQEITAIAGGDARRIVYHLLQVLVMALRLHM